MKKLIVVQHCQSEHHINNLSGGWTDTPLTDFGRQQAARIGERLKAEMKPGKIDLYTSDLLRASQSAEIIGSHIGIRPVPAKELREINCGIATNKTKDWCKANIIPFPLGEGRIDHRIFLEAETLREHYTRVCRFMDALDRQGVAEAILVVHGGTLTKIILWWLHIPVESQNYSYFGGKVGGITYLTTEKDTNIKVLSVFSDIAHLQGLETK